MASPMFPFHRKKHPRQIDRGSRDGGTGMSADTKKHFEKVKRKMFAFVGQQAGQDFDAGRLAPPQFQHRPPSPFVDQNAGPRSHAIHHTPMPPRRNLPPHPIPPPHRQLAHLGLATPQVQRHF